MASKRLIASVLAMAASSCTGAPGAPAGSDDVVGMDIVCRSISAGQVLSLFVGQTEDSCDALATFRSGKTTLVSLAASWSVANPEVVSAGPSTLPNGGNPTPVIAITGLSAGQTAVSASYGGHTGSQQVKVSADDYMRFAAIATGGAYAPGSTSTLSAVVDYSVASDSMGQLTLTVSDQSAVVARISKIVPKGYGIAILNSEFVVPADSIRVCPTVTLQVGSHTFSDSPPDACVTVVR